MNTLNTLPKNMLYRPLRNPLRLFLSALMVCTLAACGGGNDSTTTSSTSSTPSSSAPSTATPTSLAGCMKAAGGPTDACLIAVQATTTEAECNTLGGCSGTKSDGSFVYSKALSGCATQKNPATGKSASSANCNGAIAASTSAAACTDMGAYHSQGHMVVVQTSDTTLRTKLKCAAVNITSKK
jgi:hypothetical protein